MQSDYCLECGHLLSKQRDLCPFCGWQESSEEDHSWLKMESELCYPYPERFRAEALWAL